MPYTQIASDNSHIEFISSCGKAFIIPIPNMMKISDIIDKIAGKFITESNNNRGLKFLISRHPLKLELEQTTNIEITTNESNEIITRFIPHNKLATLIMSPNLICLECDRDHKQCKNPIVKIMTDLFNNNQRS